jgi:hypothetical protein
MTCKRGVIAQHRFTNKYLSSNNINKGHLSLPFDFTEVDDMQSATLITDWDTLAKHNFNKADYWEVPVQEEMIPVTL